MIGFIVLALILAPLVFQIVYGRKAIGEDIRFGFWQICGISLVLEIVFSVSAFSLFNYDFQNSVPEGQFRCGMPLAGLFVFELFFAAVLILIMIIQFFIKRYYDR